MRIKKFRSRYRRILGFFARAILSSFYWETVLPRLGLGALSARTRARRLAATATRFRALAIRMGGVMIKVGQFLSSRLDVLPPEITSVLASLQDAVPPERFSAIRSLAEAELGASLGEKFESFETEPLAAASLGQVHRAKLKPEDAVGLAFREIVVKIQRPGIEVMVEVDLAALERVAGWLGRRPSIARHVDLGAVFGEFARVTRAELDYLAEGANAEAIGSSFKGERGIRVPAVVWARTTRRVLCLEDVFAIRIGDYEGISAAGVDRAEVARRLLDCYLKQIFDDGFFHADPHPGNLFVDPAGGPRGWRLSIVDFGMVGRMPKGLRLALREAVVAVGSRDSEALVKACDELGLLMPGADRAEIGRALGQALDLVWGKGLSELRDIDRAEMARFAERFRGLLYEMPFRLPGDLLMLGRTIGILSGMCAGLDPDFNVWARIEPYAAKIAAAEAGPFLKRLISESFAALRTLAGLPAKLDRALTSLERGASAPAGAGREWAGRKSVEVASKRVTAAIVFSGSVVGGALLLPTLPLAGEILLGLSALALLSVLLRR